MAKQPVLVDGGPCGQCNATVAHDRWRSGKKGTEHEGKPCCHKRDCKVALGLEKPETPEERKARRDTAKAAKAAAKTAAQAQQPPASGAQQKRQPSGQLPEQHLYDTTLEFDDRPSCLHIHQLVGHRLVHETKLTDTALRCAAANAEAAKTRPERAFTGAEIDICPEYLVCGEFEDSKFAVRWVTHNQLLNCQGTAGGGADSNLQIRDYPQLTSKVAVEAIELQHDWWAEDVKDGFAAEREDEDGWAELELCVSHAQACVYNVRRGMARHATQPSLATHIAELAKARDMMVGWIDRFVERANKLAAPPAPSAADARRAAWEAGNAAELERMRQHGSLPVGRGGNGKARAPPSAPRAAAPAAAPAPAAGASSSGLPARTRAGTRAAHDEPPGHGASRKRSRNATAQVACADECAACAKPVPWDRERHNEDPRHRCNACKRLVHSSSFMCMDAGAMMSSLVASDGEWYCSEVCQRA
jgi:hypothetical protein